MKLYHATFSKLARKIKKAGYLGNSPYKMWSDSQNKYVYLAVSEDIAYSYAETCLDELENERLYDMLEDDEIVIFEVDTKDLDLSKLKKDANVIDGNATYQYEGTIPYNVLKVVDYRESINEVLEAAGIQLDESVKLVNKDSADTKLVTSAYELNEIIKNDTEKRIVYDKQKNWFLVGNAENSIHVELLNDALIDGVYPPFEWNDHFLDGNGGDGIDDDGATLYHINPDRFVLFRTSSDPNNLIDYRFDNYTNCYSYKDYYVYDRKGNFKETPLYHLLGQPEAVEQLTESILDAKSVGDELMNIILKNPTRKELRDNDMNICRGAMGRSGNFYFISLSQLAHCDLFDTLEQMGINDAPYNTFKYSNKTNTFYYYDPDNDLDFNLIKKELESSPYFKNFAGCKFDTFDDTEFDPELYEGYNPLNETEDLRKFNRIAGFYHYDTGEFELFPRTSEDISVEDDEVNDYIHNVHSKDEFTEFNIVRFGIEDIPGEGVVCYIEGDTKRNVEKCYYAILEKYAEECDIIKYELEYYVGNEHKYIFLDRYGKQLMESIIHAKSSGDKLTDIILKNPTRRELEENNITNARCMEDDEGNWYFCDLFNNLHYEIENLLRDNVGFPYFDGDDSYGISYYDAKANEFWYNSNEMMPREKCVAQYYESSYLRKNFPDAYIRDNPYGNNSEDYEEENIELDESVFWKGEKINNYEQGSYPYEGNNDYDKEDEMIVWKNPSAEWMKYKLDSGEYFRFCYISKTDELFVWYGENGFHRDTMDITGADGDVIGTMTKNHIDYWPDDDDSPKVGDMVFRQKRKDFLDTIYPNGYTTGVQY